MSELNTHEEPPLTNKELKEIRSIIEADIRMKWFWASARSISIWLIAVIGALSIGWDALVKLVLHLVGK